MAAGFVEAAAAVAGEEVETDGETVKVVEAVGVVGEVFLVVWGAVALVVGVVEVAVEPVAFLDLFDNSVAVSLLNYLYSQHYEY